MSIGKIRIDLADKYMWQWVRLRDMACQRCGSAVRLNDKGLPITHQASHFQGRRKESTRFDPSNLDCLCSGCHSYFTANPAEHYEWQVKRKGQKLVDEIVLKSNLTQKKQRGLEAIFWKRRLRQDYNVW